MRRLRTGRTCAAGWQEFICQGEADFRFEVPEKEAHCRHSAAGARLLRETHHDELQPPVHYKVMKLLTKRIIFACKKNKTMTIAAYFQFVSHLQRPQVCVPPDGGMLGR